MVKSVLAGVNKVEWAVFSNYSAVGHETEHYSMDF